MNDKSHVKKTKIFGNNCNAKNIKTLGTKDLIWDETDKKQEHRQHMSYRTDAYETNQTWQLTNEAGTQNDDKSKIEINGEKKNRKKELM